MDKLMRMRLEQEQRDRRQDLRRRLMVMDMMSIVAKSGASARSTYFEPDFIDPDFIE